MDQKRATSWPVASRRRFVSTEEGRGRNGIEAPWVRAKKRDGRDGRNICKFLNLLNIYKKNYLHF